MSTWALPPLMIASIVFYLAIYHLFLFIRKPSQTVNLTFSLSCFSVVLYEIFCAGLYNSQTVSEGVLWQRAQFSSASLMTIGFVWFFRDYSKIVSKPFLYTLTALCASLLVAGVIFPDLLVQAGAPSIKNISLPFGGSVTYLEGEPGPIAFAFMGVINFAFIYLLVGLIRSSRAQKAQDPAIVPIAFTIFFLASFNDCLISLGVYEFVYTIEYSYLAIVLAMAFSLSEEIVQAVLTKEALKESEQRLALVLTAADLVIWDWNLETNKVIFNERWLELMVLDGDQLTFDVKEWRDVVHPEDREPRKAALTRHLSGENPFYEFEYRMKNCSGEWKWLLDRGKIVERSPGGKPLRAAGTTLDLTEQKTEQEEKHRLENQLLHAQKLESIGRLSAGIAHDLNNMLAPILCLSDLIAEDLGKDHPQTDDLQDIRAAALRAKELTQQLLAYSRKQVLQVTVVDLNEIIQNLGSFFRRLIPESIRIDFKLAAKNGKTKVDPTQVQQILMNLVVNAGDAISENGTITIETCEVELTDTVPGIPAKVNPGRYVSLAVQDTGHGISKDQLDVVFEPFFTTKEQGRGTGLGLSTVFGIVKQHGGYIKIDSELRQGTKLTIYLPQSSETISRAPGRPVSEPPPRIDASVMIVEDDDEVRKVAVRVLSKIGYRVVEAPGGAEAIRIFRELPEPPHLLLTDVIMPEMNGLDLFQELSAYESNLKVLFMSGYADILTEQQGVISQDTHLLRKPFTAHTLTEKVREVLLG